MVTTHGEMLDACSTAYSCKEENSFPANTAIKCMHAICHLAMKPAHRYRTC